MLLLLNPKAYVIIGLMFSQLTNAENGSNIFVVFVIATVFALNNLIAFPFEHMSVTDWQKFFA